MNGSDRRQNTWLRFSVSRPGALAAIEDMTGVDVKNAVGRQIMYDGRYSLFHLDFLSVEEGKNMESRVLFLLGEGRLISLEPDRAPAPLDVAEARLARRGWSEDAFECFSLVLQSINDAADEFLDALSDGIGEGLIQSNSVLENLDAKGKDFGVTDVVATQVALGDIEELLSKCTQSLIQLDLAARHVTLRIPSDAAPLMERYRTLESDIASMEESVDFVHDRVQVLQAVDSLALSVKQNQIIKIFTVITAVFLPAVLVSTYYSMNLAFFPALDWKYIEPVTLLFTLLLAVLPIIYVKERGWLR